MATETLNVEAAKTAIRNATQEIEELIRNFEQTHQTVSENFAQDAGAGAAIGGNLGAAALNAFESGSSVNFNDLKAKIDNFMNVRVEQIMSANQSMAEAAEATYSNM